MEDIENDECTVKCTDLKNTMDLEKYQVDMDSDDSCVIIDVENDLYKDSAKENDLNDSNVTECRTRKKLHSKTRLSNLSNSEIGTDKTKNNREEVKKRKIEEKRLKEVEKELERKRKEEEKRLREQEKEEEKKKKEEERRLKELEKEEEKRKREEEKKLKELEKEEDRKKREEEKRQREYEREQDKRRKDEEKRLKDEEKRREEEEKNRKIQKQSNILLSFLNKSKTEEPKTKAEEFVNKQSNTIKVGQFYSMPDKINMRSGNYIIVSKPEMINFTFDELLKINRSVNMDNLQGIRSDTVEEEEENKERLRFKVKTFYFSTDVRPGYCGTWSKTSDLIRGRNPLYKDETINYETYSEDDWEYESGEDIANSDGEEEEEDNEEENTGFFVPHGYLSEDEDGSDDELRIENANKSSGLNKDLLAKKEQEFQDKRDVKYRLERPIQVVFGFDLPELECFTVRRRLATTEAIVCTKVNVTECGDTHKRTKDVPSTSISDLIKLVHCSPMNQAKLAYEFRMFWEIQSTQSTPEVTFVEDIQGIHADEFSISKGKIIKKIKDIANWDGSKWMVKPEILTEYNFINEDNDVTKPLVAKWNYCTKVYEITKSTRQIIKEIREVKHQDLREKNIMTTDDINTLLAETEAKPSQQPLQEDVSLCAQPQLTQQHHKSDLLQTTLPFQPIVQTLPESPKENPPKDNNTTSTTIIQ